MEMANMNKIPSNYGHNHYYNNVQHHHQSDFVFKDNHHALEQYCGKYIRPSVNGSNRGHNQVHI